MRIHRVRARERERKEERESNLKHCQQLSPHFSRCYPLSLSLSLSYFACKCNGRRRISKMNPLKAGGGEEGVGAQATAAEVVVFGAGSAHFGCKFRSSSGRTNSHIPSPLSPCTPSFPLSPLCSLCLADYATGFACLIYVQKHARHFN